MRYSSSILANSLQFVLFYVFNFIFRLVTGIIIARTIGVEGKGIYSLVLLTNALALILLNPGLHTAMTYLTSSQKFSPPELARFGLMMAGGFSAFGFLVWWGSRPLLAKSILNGISPIYLLLALISVPIGLSSLYLSHVLLGRQQILAFNLVESGRLLGNLGLQVISAFFQAGLPGVILSWLAANCIGLLLAVWHLRRGLFQTWQVSGRLAQAAVGYGIRSYPANILAFINTRLDVFILNAFRGVGQVGLYSIAAGLAEGLWFFPNASGNSVFARIPQLEDQAARQLIAQTCRQNILVMAFLSVTAFFLGPALIALFYGPAFAPASEPFFYLLPGILGMGIQRILAANFNGRGNPQVVTITAIVSSLVTLVLDFTLIPVMGMSGAALASSGAYLTGAGMLIIYYLRESQLSWAALLVPTRQDISELVHFSRELYDRLIKLFARDMQRGQ